MKYEWNIAQMDRNAADGFVTTVHYTVSVVDGDYTASTYGTVGYTQEDKAYVPFANLTKEQVIGWVKDSLGQKTVEAVLATQIEAQKNPNSVSGLPWNIA